MGDPGGYRYTFWSFNFLFREPSAGYSWHSGGCAADQDGMRIGRIDRVLRLCKARCCLDRNEATFRMARIDDAGHDRAEFRRISALVFLRINLI